jgi:GTP-binding protein EngB required for normal cell division
LISLLRETDPAAATRIEQLRATRPDVASVVVVGETNRGKSSLVNALLACPGLSPVDAGTATATYVVFQYGEQWAARACYPGQYEPVAFDPGELAGWISTGGELPDGQLPPSHVEVDAPVPLLRRLSLVDTPGVGGLDAIHGELARQAAEAATALLFVVDDSAPFTSGEIAFLTEIAEQVETVIFAVTKIDQFRGWRQVVNANRKLLAEHAPRFAHAAFHPVSPRMFELAGTTPKPDTARLLRERAGIPKLQEDLQDLVAGRSAMLAEANTLRALDTALGELSVALEAHRQILSAKPGEIAVLQARRDVLTGERRAAARGWQVRLRGEIQRARMESGHDVSRQIRDTQSWFRQAIEGADRGTLADLPAQVDAALHLVSHRIGVGLAERLTKVADVVLAELFTPDEIDALRRAAARGGQPPIMLRPPERRPPTPEDKLLVFLGVSGGFGAARVAALPLAGLGVAALTPLVLPVTIAIGLGAGWWMARTRKHAADKQHLKQWLTEAIADARSALDQVVSEQLIEAEQQLALALDDAIARRIELIEARIRDVDAALKMAATERAAQLGAVNRRLAEVSGARERSAQLLTSIRKIRDRV